MGQFGSYPAQPAVLRTAAGQEIPVYRIKYWRFDKGAPALQLEYESPVPLSDTAAVRTVAHSVWPVFVVYVDSAGLSDAILTATTLKRRRVGWLRTSRAESFGILAHRDSLGRWHFARDGEALPSAEALERSGIFQPDGSRVPLTLGRREAESFR